jgi:RNA polymerase sigma-70 factor (ECF subfamily)
VRRPKPDPLAHPERLTRSVYAYVAYRIGPGHDAEDVTSEVFERALRYRSGFDPARGTPSAWLTGIARRVLAERRTAPVDQGDAAAESAAPGELERESVDRLTVQSAVAALPARDRELIALRYGADLTAAQIAAQLDMTTNAVEVALHRALERLRQVMQPATDTRRADGPATAAI